MGYSDLVFKKNWNVYVVACKLKLLIEMMVSNVYDIWKDLDNTTQIQSKWNLIYMNLNSIIFMFDGKRLEEQKLLSECNVVTLYCLWPILKDFYGKYLP